MDDLVEIKEEFPVIWIKSHNLALFKADNGKNFPYISFKEALHIQ
ncbi:hypothetical protein [Ureibacillus chungkukjangi]|nr:hypothetical protein [Ureibacillus chungkukjangi]